MIMKVMRSHARTFVEAALLLRLDGRAGAPRLLGYGAEQPMLLLESLLGCNFLFLLQDAAVPLSLHLQVVKRVVQHLREMHAIGIVHNDVAIPNVVVHVDADYQLRDVRLVEFTVACPSGDSLALDVEPGAFPCVAPEVARGGASTPAADVYSLGALLRELSQVKANADELPL
ncbi:serine/threonine-protein kinase PknL-like [Penaeus vannamei]|uniref:serine/threonine-protein kinase PknL-like n=1 Tax=Penaeus vannamei TaxID=6689 RepID=UPI00387F8CFA